VIEEPTREQRIAACLKTIASQPEFPAFSHHIQAVMTAIDDEGASLQRLTSMVLRDYSLTLRVLQMANSESSHRFGRPVVSVAQSIALLGTESIRGLAGGAALYEPGGKISPGLKELMLLSLLTASQTRAVAVAVNYPRPEEAYLCGMFRNLGELLIASYFPRQYAEVLLEMKGSSLGQRGVCLQVLHFTFEELGQATAKQWELPDRVAQCMGAGGPLHKGADDTELAVLRAATAFSHALTTAVYRRDPEGSAARVNRLVLDCFPVLGLRHDQVNGVLETGIVETRTTFAALSAPLDSLRLRRQAEAAASLAAGEPG
jgi:HD-like signal output (HDOD) protein